MKKVKEVKEKRWSKYVIFLAIMSVVILTTVILTNFNNKLLNIPFEHTWQGGCFRGSALCLLILALKGIFFKIAILLTSLLLIYIWTCITFRVSFSAILNFLR